MLPVIKHSLIVIRISDVRPASNSEFTTFHLPSIRIANAGPNMEHRGLLGLDSRYYIFIFIHQKTVEKKNNTKTMKSERKANNLTKQVKLCKHFPIQFIIYSSTNHIIIIIIKIVYTKYKYDINHK